MWGKSLSLARIFLVAFANACSQSISRTGHRTIFCYNIYVYVCVYMCIYVFMSKFCLFDRIYIYACIFFAGVILSLCMFVYCMCLNALRPVYFFFFTYICMHLLYFLTLYFPMQAMAHCATHDYVWQSLPPFNKQRMRQSRWSLTCHAWQYRRAPWRRPLCGLEKD